MTDYTKNANFTAKTGQVIQGADFDSEFDEIASSSATKEDKISKGAANGYAPLNASTKLADTYLTSNVPLLDGSNAFTGTNSWAGSSTFSNSAWISGAYPYLGISETGVTANSGKWLLYAEAENLYLYAATDDLVSAYPAITVARTGTTVDSVTLTAGTAISLAGPTSTSSTFSVGTNATIGGSLGVSGTTTLAALLATTGSFSSTLAASGNFTVGASVFTVAAASGNTTVFGTLGVTGAATLSSTLGVTGATTLSSTLSVAGATTFTGAVTKASAGSFLSYGSATQTNGAITVSTSAPSGTPNAGDLWFRYTA